MSANFNIIINFVVACILATAISNAALAGDAVVDIACDGNECSKSIDLTDEQSNVLCENDRLILSWNRLRPSDYMVQCSCNCTSQMNSNWLVNTDRGQVDGFYGRFVTLEFARNVNNETKVPDKFAPIEICKVPTAELAKSGSFSLLYKRPDEEIPPYCYEVIFVFRRNGNNILQGIDGEIARNNPNYWIQDIPLKQRSLLLSIVREVTDTGRN